MGSKLTHKRWRPAKATACKVAARDGSQISPIEPKCSAFPADGGLVHVFRRKQHVGARVAVEQEFALAVGREQNEGRRGARRPRKAQRHHIHARVGQEVAEAVVPDLAHESARHAQPREADRDVRGHPAGRLPEHLGGAEVLPRDFRHEVHQQLAEADDVGHGIPIAGTLAGRPGGTARSGRGQRLQPWYSPTFSRVTSLDGIRIIGFSGRLPFMML